MKSTRSTRRRFLTGLAGSTIAVGLAGCLSQGQSSDADGAEEDHQEGEDSHDEEGGHHDGNESDGGGSHEEEVDGDGHHHDEGAPEAPSPSAHVALNTEGSEHHFDPHLVWVEAGGTVTWETESGSHDVVAYHPDNDDKPLRMPESAEPWESELLGEGETVTHTFETEGVYDYFCTPHESVGMVGSVIVGEPDAHDQPALAEPQESLPDGARSQLADLGQQANEALGHTH